MSGNGMGGNQGQSTSNSCLDFVSRGMGPGEQQLDEVMIVDQQQGSNSNAQTPLQGQLQVVLKHLDNMSNIIVDSTQLRNDALKCFEDNLLETRKLHIATELKLDAFRNLVTAVGPAVGIEAKK